MTAPANKFGRWIKEVAVSSSPSNLFLGTPSLYQCANGDLLAFWDEFGPAAHTDGTDYDRSHFSRSSDGGVTWSAASTMDGYFWGGFLPPKGDGNIYRMSVSRQYGSLQITRSTDDGLTWAAPAVLRAESVGVSHYHRGPVPCLIHDGYLYVGAEVDNEKTYPVDNMFVGRVSVASNWMDAGQWAWTAAQVPNNPAWGVQATSEGNIVFDRTDLRYIGRADIITPGERSYFFESVINTSTFTLGTLVSRPANGGHTKFEIHADPDGEGFWIIHNPMPIGSFLAGLDYRTLLALSHVDALTDLGGDNHDTIKLWIHEAPNSVRTSQGFQYPTMLFDGDDIIGLIRTAWNGASTYHDSNRIQFFRIPNYRELKS